MKTKQQLQKRIEELESKIDLEKHTKKYIHIPKPNLLPLLGFIFFGILSYLNLKILDLELIKVIFSSEEVIRQFPFQISHLINIYPIFGEYILICLTLISLVALLKGGYRNIKPYDENGLISGFIYGLIIGLAIGLTIGLINGLIIGLIYGLIYGLIIGLIYGLIYGLIGGLIIGLMGESY